MAYEKTIWKDRVVEKPNTYRTVENPDGTITLYPVPGQVIEKGTPVSAANLNKIEDGIAKLNSDMETIVNEIIYPDMFIGFSDTEKLQKAYDLAIEKTKQSILPIIKLNRTFIINNQIVNKETSFYDFVDIRDGIIKYNGSGALFTRTTNNQFCHAPRFYNVRFVGSGNNKIFDSSLWIRFNFDLCTFNNISCLNSSSGYIQTLRFLNCEVGEIGNLDFISAPQSFDVVIDNSRFEQISTSYSAIKMVNTSTTNVAGFGFRITNSLFEGYTNSAPIIFSGIYGCEIDGCYFESNKSSIKLVSNGVKTFGLTISNCSFGSLRDEIYHIQKESSVNASSVFLLNNTVKVGSGEYFTNYYYLKKYENDTNHIYGGGKKIPVNAMIYKKGGYDVTTTYDETKGLIIEIPIDNSYTGGSLAYDLNQILFSVRGNYGGSVVYSGYITGIFGIDVHYDTTSTSLKASLDFSPLMVRNMEGNTNGGSNTYQSTLINYYFKSSGTKFTDYTLAKDSIVVELSRWKNNNVVAKAIKINEIDSTYLGTYN